ncbi:hypothetical protein LDENG_00035210 [Lucifuga dentata]|nr:hypothetical protein LDENG_00035210 [Lucifuga dentata]
MVILFGYKTDHVIHFKLEYAFFPKAVYCSVFLGVSGFVRKKLQAGMDKESKKKKKSKKSRMKEEERPSEDCSASCSNKSKSEAKQEATEEDDAAAAAAAAGDDDDDPKLSLISWNVDGLDAEKQVQRAKSFCSSIREFCPDVVFLQELVLAYVTLLKKQLEHTYTFIQGAEKEYFTGMMLKKSRIKLLDSEIIKYPLTHMMRNLLVAQVTFRGQKLCLMTSHLESCKENANERMRQMRMVMRKMKDAPDDVTVLFGGDTNLRDDEVAKVGVPSSVFDVWERLEQPEDCRYTWDTKNNNNRRLHFYCRFRFDRIYLRPATRDGVPHLEPDQMALLGQERLQCGCFTSDHWGIYCTFSAA